MSTSSNLFKRLDDAADRAARRSAKWIVGGVALILAAIVLVPILAKGPVGLLEAIANFGFTMNESGAEGYNVDPGISASPPEGCDPDKVTAIDVPGSGTLYQGGC